MSGFLWPPKKVVEWENDYKPLELDGTGASHPNDVLWRQRSSDRGDVILGRWMGCFNGLRFAIVRENQAGGRKFKANRIPEFAMASALNSSKI